MLPSHLQVSTCNQSCTLHGLMADCSAQSHHWVPVLPPTITHLFLEMNYIREINSTSLSSYEHLVKLDLGMQRVPLVIRDYAFHRQEKLTWLVLGQNRDLKLEPMSFARMFNLQHLFLDTCNLTDSILAESYLEPLVSLETLDLSGNRIVTLRPGLFFSNLTRFKQLNLKLNQIERLCEEDLAGFRGKYFTLMKLNSNYLHKMYRGGLNLEMCGNPFRGMTFDMLDLSLNNFNLNETHQFFKQIEGTPIAHLIFSGAIGKDFSHDNLPDPNESTFKGLTKSSIYILDLSGNRIFALQRAVFSPLMDVTIIDLSKNKINEIKRNAFDGLRRHLLKLNLSSNLLGEIFSHTFTSLTSLRELDLSYNHIGALGYKSFSGLPMLRILHLTGNSLRHLGFPATLPNLDYLVLDDNKLKSVISILGLAMNSVYVDVSANRLTNLEDIYVILSHFNRLQYFFYGGNSIKWCELSTGIAIPHNRSLERLDLHDSSLHIFWEQGRCLDFFDHLKNLLNLNLRMNSLATLPWGIFRGLDSIRLIDLSFNALTYLQLDVFPVSLKVLYLSNNFLASPDPVTFQSLSYLSLAGNRFHCDCHLESFLMWLSVTNITFLSPVEDYRCEFPAALHGLPLLNYTTSVEPCEKDDEEAVRDLKLALFIFSALLVITAILSGIVYARLRGNIFISYKKLVSRVLKDPKPTPSAHELHYDAFLCFSNNDYRWVEAAVLKKLDNKFSEKNIFRCCFEARDFLPGEDHLSNIRDAIWGSRKTVCIVSKEFLKGIGIKLKLYTLYTASA